MKNKRGQGLSTTAIILIILGVVLLVVLIIGFVMGWENIAPWLSGDNVDAIVQQCGVACSTNSIYDYCSKNRTLKVDDLPGGIKEKEGSCDFFANESNVNYTKYGIKECPGLC